MSDESIEDSLGGDAKPVERPIFQDEEAQVPDPDLDPVVSGDVDSVPQEELGGAKEVGAMVADKGAVEPAEILASDAKEGDSAEGVSKGPGAWRTSILLKLFVGLALIAVAYVSFKMMGAQRQTDVVRSARPGEIPISLKSAREMAEFLKPITVESARELAVVFAGTEDPEERLKWVRGQKEVQQHWPLYSPQALTGAVKKLVPLGVVKSGGGKIYSFGAVLDSGEKRFINIVPTVKGPRIDWDSYARYCSATWPQLLSGEAKSAEVRVYAKPDTYYNYDFRDGEKWDCFVLKSPELERIVYAYALEGSLEAEILNSTLPWTEGDGLPMTLRISATPAGAKNRQFLIERVLASNWVLAEQDLQDTWVSVGPTTPEPIDLSE